MVQPVKKLSEKIPTLQTQLLSVAGNLEQKLGPKSTGVIGKIKSFIGKILTQLQQFLSKLFSKQGAKAAATGVAVYGAGHVVGSGISAIDKEGKVGNAIVSFDDKMRKLTGKGDVHVSDTEGDAILATLRYDKE